MDVEARSERIERGIRVLRKLSPHPSRYAKHIEQSNRYVQIQSLATDQQLEAHLVGHELVGGIASDDDGTTTCVGLDVDAHTSEQRPEAATKRFCDTCRMVDVPVLVHRSKSGKGMHVRTCFEGSVPSFFARALYVSLCIAAGIEGDKAVDKVWPPTFGYGVLALPYQAAWARRTGGTLAVDPGTLEPLPRDAQLDSVLDGDEMQYGEVLSVLDFLGVSSARQAKAISGFTGYVGQVKDGLDGGVQYMVRECAAVQRLVDEAETLPYEFWFGMMTNFKPFMGGKELFQAFSELDERRWNKREFDRSWEAVRGKPRMCWNLDNNWRCPLCDKCGAKSPAGLPFFLKRLGKSSLVGP